MARDFINESLSHDPIHGYIPFIARSGLPEGEAAEQDVIDHPWVQRMRQIHQLQTAWWVFPSAEHMRFQHILGAMHLASVAIDRWYESLCDSTRNVPSRRATRTNVRSPPKPSASHRGCAGIACARRRERPTRPFEAGESAASAAPTDDQSRLAQPPHPRATRIAR